MATKTENLWRCTECRKWSHAQRKPNSHKRFIENGSDSEHPDWSAENIAAYLELPTDSVVESTWSGDPDTYEDPGGAWVLCGPFEEWKAYRVDDQD